MNPSAKGKYQSDRTVIDGLQTSNPDINILVKRIVQLRKEIVDLLKVLKTLFNYDHLYIGGGNARELTFKLDKNVTLVTNQDGIKGGARLWAEEKTPTAVVPSSTIK